MKTNFKNLLMCFLLLLGARLLSAPGGAETDSTKSKYPLDDPRNPNCPCHQYQAQADREYAKLQAVGESKADLVVKTEAFGSHKKVKKIHTRHWFRTSNQPHKVKAIKRKRFRDRLSRCFHF